MYLNTKAIVLSEYQTKTNDRLLCVLTEKKGRLNVLARGAKSIKSKLFSACAPFTYSDMVIFENKDRYIINEADIIKSFAFSSDILSLALCQYFCQVVSFISTSDGDEETHKSFISLLANCFYALSKENANMDLIKSVFELRSLCIAGYMPLLDECAQCYAEINESAYFNAFSGNLLCKNCAHDKKLVTLGALKAMEHISQADAKKIFSFSISQDILKELNAITEQCLLSILDTKFSCLDFYKTAKAI